MQAPRYYSPCPGDLLKGTHFLRDSPCGLDDHGEQALVVTVLLFVRKAGKGGGAALGFQDAKGAGSEEKSSKSPRMDKEEAESRNAWSPGSLS